MKITQVPSPNYDLNRTTVDRIVIHWIVGNLASADAQFKKTNSTSAHYGIEDDEIHQYVGEIAVAYHAGNYAMNQRSIGIEHSASPDRPASDKTYETSGKLIAEIAERYSIPLDRKHIIKHSEVIATQCCGTIDIDRLIRIAKGSVEQPVPTTPPGDIKTESEKKAIDDWDLTLRGLKDMKLISSAAREDNGHKSVIKAITEVLKEKDIEKQSELREKEQDFQEALKNLATQANKLDKEVQVEREKVLQAQEDLKESNNKISSLEVKLLEQQRQIDSMSSNDEQGEKIKKLEEDVEELTTDLSQYDRSLYKWIDTIYKKFPQLP